MRASEVSRFVSGDSAAFQSSSFSSCLGFSGLAFKSFAALTAQAFVLIVFYSNKKSGARKTDQICNRPLQFSRLARRPTLLLASRICNRSFAESPR